VIGVPADDPRLVLARRESEINPHVRLLARV